jgi:peptidoglycan hydrolase-like protein with peptidoglycan-binding domain
MARTLKRGDRGVYVERLQAALIATGFPVGAAGPDGDFGGGTESAVRRFQAERGLPETGAADPDTIAALDLDPETLEDLIELDTPGAPTGTGPGGDADRIIQDYADSRADFEAAIINSLQDALNNFESVLSHASTEEAKSDVMGAVFDKLLESLVKDVFDELGKVNPWAKAGAYVIDGFKAASDEMKRAETARRSVTVRDWLLRQREQINQAGWAAGDRTRIREELRRQLAGTDDAQTFLDGLTGAIQAFRDARIANRAMLGFELTLFETWINAFFTGTRGPGQGYVVLIFDTDSDPWELKGTRLLAPEGDKVKDGVGQILARSADPADAKIRDGLRPFALDLRVHKFVVFGHSGSNFLVAEEMGEPLRAAALNAAYSQWGAFFDPNNERLTTPEDELSRLRMEAALGGDNRLELNVEWR